MKRLLLTFATLGLAGAAVIAGAAVVTVAVADFEQWSELELALVRSLSLQALPPLPADPSNRFADDPRAAELGKALFFDPGLSSNGKVACASCHLPNRGFQDDLPLGRGIGTTRRRTMPIAGSAYAPFLFWDGRKDSLWAQALGPLESAAEHATDRTAVAKEVASKYRADYEAVFGQMPDLSDLPAFASPVADAEASAKWDAMSVADQMNVDRIFANVGKAIAAYERTIPVPLTRFDSWVTSPSFPDPGMLSPDEIAGLRLFVGKAECVNCHNGPLLSDFHFHNTGVPSAAGLPEDQGRKLGTELVRTDEFNCLGQFSDASETDCNELRFMAAPDEDTVYAFKTPSLRAAASRAPFMHAGQMTSLEAVIGHYSAAPAAPIGHSELRALNLTKQEEDDLIAFLGTLDTETPAQESTE